MIAEYQRVTPLTLGELWAIPAMLRMGYLENVRRMALRAARDIADRASADEWVSRLLAATLSGDAASGLSAFVHRGPDADAGVPDALPPADPQPAIRLHAAALARAVGRRRRDDGGGRGAALGAGVGAHAARDGELDRQSCALVTEHRLDRVRRDGERDRGRACATIPSGTYAAMTRATRDRYRHAVERIAKGTDLDEPAIAAAAVQAARDAAVDRRR